jgi:formiminoglutamase
MPDLDMSVWTGRDDTPTEGPEALQWHQRIQPCMAQKDRGVVLVGFACDEGVKRNGGRPGAVEGPKALRRALANLAWHQDHPVYDTGDVNCVNADLENAQQKLAVQIAELVMADQRPLTLGGGHETAWGTIQGLFRARPKSSIGLINIDAHFDLRAADRSTSGTPFAQAASLCQKTERRYCYFCFGIAEPANTAALFKRAHELDVLWRLDTDLHAGRLADDLNRVSRFIAGCDLVYLSLDLDVLPGSVMPAVSAPAGRGVQPEVVEAILAEVASSGKLAATDVVEFNPQFDRDGCAARVAAGLIWRIARLWTDKMETAP